MGPQHGPEAGMDIELLRQWIEQYPTQAAAGLVAASLLALLLARQLIGRALTGFARRTKTQVDDILVRRLRPFRMAWLAPLVLVYLLADFFPGRSSLMKTGSLFFILWLAAFTLNALMDAINEIYEASASFRGASIQGYLDIAKIFVLLAAAILSISLLTGQSPVVLLTGLGALTAVLLLIFRDTILSLVASVQISTQDLVKEGDWIEVPSYGADGDVVNMSLHTIKVQNFDKTFSVIPTHMITQVAYRNWRGMQESGGRRIKRAIHMDLASVRFCDAAMLDRFRKVDVLQPFLDKKIAEIDQENRERGIEADSMLDGRQLTNIGAFRAYLEAYLGTHPGIHTVGMAFLVRQLAPGPTGLPLEVYVFTKTTDWVTYEQTQADVFDHLLASVPYFDLRVFQEPTGFDFGAMAGATARGLLGQPSESVGSPALRQ
jgi:miniconductance mechanosensitive channel